MSCCVVESWGCTRVESGDPSPTLPVDTLVFFHTAVIPVLYPSLPDLPRGALSVGTTGAEKQTDNVEAVSTFETKAMVGWVFSYPTNDNKYS